MAVPGPDAVAAAQGFRKTPLRKIMIAKLKNLIGSVMLKALLAIVRK